MRAACLSQAAIVLGCLMAQARADLADAYLTGLRQRGWHDTALQYLETADQDPIATPAFLEKLGYERATTLVALARESASEKKRQKLLTEAIENFQQFAQENSQSTFQLQALATAGNLLIEQALVATNKAEKLPNAARSQREQLQTAARDLLSQAKKPLETLQEVCASKLQSQPKAAELQKDPAAKAFQQQLLAKQAESQFLLATLDFEKSRTYEPKTKERQESLEIAAKAFEKLYNDYDGKLVGFYARLYQGRCYQSAGKLNEALECYWDLVDQPPIPNQEFRRLVARAVRHRAECHIQNGDLEKAIEECNEWLEESRGPELSQPEWLAVSYQLATAYDAQAAAAKEGDSQRFRTEARKLYREIAKVPGEFQLDARAKMTSSGEGKEEAILAKTFEEAFLAGQDALEQMNSAKLAAKLAQENNPAAVESLGEQALEYQALAKDYFEQAVTLVDEQTDREQLVTARYYLCWLYWEAGRLDDAAVVGQFIARRYPENRYAPVAAKLALAAYERLYNAAKQAGETADFEANQLTEVAELLAQRWPESPEAATGVNLLMNIALRDDRLAEAEELLERLPAASRATAELRLGRALWTRFLQASRTDQAGPDSAAVALKEKAKRLLASGYEAVQENPTATVSEATSLLYYAQLLLADGDAERAIAVLENPNAGPLSIVDSHSSAATNESLVQETYKVALRAYVSVEPPKRDKAQAMMENLESSLHSGADAEKKLLNLYVSLGLQLQQQISALSAEGKADKARAVATAFEDLLARVTARAGAADSWQVQSWIAQTNLQLGQGLSGEDAKRYFKQATEAYQTLLTKAEREPKFAPSPIAVLSARKRLADGLLLQQQYADALKNYAAILRSKPNMLELQLAAATALQEWGTTQKNAEKLDESIRGAMPQANQKNLIWGWLRLAKIADQAMRRAAARGSEDPAQVRKVKKYENLFYEARLHVARARFEAAKLATGSERQKQLRTARQSLESMQRLYPDLGGPRWQSAYQKLLTEMEQEK